MGIVLAAAGCTGLVLLPVVGLIQIDRTTSESHHYTRILSGTDQLGTRLLQLVTGSLARYGASGTAETRAEAVEALRLAREQYGEIEGQFANAQALGIDESLGGHLAKAKAVMDLADQFVAEIDGGARTANAPTRQPIVAAAGALLTSQGEFALAISPTRVQLDEQQRDSLREAQVLLGGAVAIAVVTLGTLLLLDNRRVAQVFAAQETRRESAEKLAAHRADVVNMASHELRNPLTVLTLSTEMMRRAAESGTDPLMADLAGDAHVAALRCEALVNELLDLGRLDADRLQLKMGSTALLPALNDAVAMSAAHHGVHPLLISGAESTRVSADPDRLRVILRNLIDNAFKYSPPGSNVHVHVEKWEDKVRIEVKDEGLGIPEADRERIFQRFERATSTAHVPGVGIGLYLSRELARRMDGELRCSSSDAGAAFSLELQHAS